MDEGPGMDVQDADAIAAFETALAGFTEELNLLHIAGGSPSYASMAAASLRPRLTKAGLNEMLAGKRFTSLDSLLEFVRVVTTPSDVDKAAAAKHRSDPALVETWRGRWQVVKLLQRRAQPVNKRLRATAREVHDDAVREAEALRTDARAEAERIRTTAQAEADRVRDQARRDADGLLERARTAAAASGSGRHGPWSAGRAGLRGVLESALNRLVAVGSVLQPAAAVTAVAGLAAAAVLVGDSFSGTSATCQPGRPEAAGQLLFYPVLRDRSVVQQAAFARQPQLVITNLKRDFPSSPSTTPEPTQSPSPTPTPTPTPSPTPSPSPSGRCPGNGS
ncbi:ATP synthase F0 subunit B [Streptomyces sp. NPDC059761]|uniref:ATP synthase F0 subunit B n=1 Tax=Streptomyces sp. NPDC059761 TaxID=3346937 RepID=UPI00365EB8C4